jgi:hypothetical protein
MKLKNFKIYQTAQFSTTNANGIATCNLIGDGSGLETYYAKSNNLVSNEVDVIDGIANISTNNNDITELQKANAVNIQLIGNKFDFTTTSESSGTYCGMYWNGQSSDWDYATVKDTTIQDLQGKTVTCLIKDVVKGDDNWNMRIYQKINNGSWSEYVDSRLALANGDNETSFVVDENATHIWCRIEPSATGTRHIQTGEWVVYQIPSEEEPTPVATTLTLTSNKDTISAYDNEKATLTATVLDQNGNAMENESVVFKKGSTTLDTVSTNSNGVAQYEYTGTGVGDVTITVECESLTQSKTIEDLWYFNDGTDLSTLTIPSNTSVTVENGALKITTSTSGEKKIPYAVSLRSSDNYIFECEIAKLGNGQPVALYVKDSTTANGLWFAYDIITNKWNGGCGSAFNNITTSTLAIGDKIRIKQENGVFTLYHNDMVIKSITRTLSGTYSIGHYTNSGRIQYIDNIKLWSI